MKGMRARTTRSEEHTSELQSLAYLVCRLLLEKKILRVNLVCPSALGVRPSGMNRTRAYHSARYSRTLYELLHYIVTLMYTFVFFFFFNDPRPTKFSPLPLPHVLPI